MKLDYFYPSIVPMRMLSILCIIIPLLSCEQVTKTQDLVIEADTIKSATVNTVVEKKSGPLAPSEKINTGNVQPEAVIAFAQSLMGTPYLYGSTDPNVGFDCSGFITHVFNHFDIKVPRSSRDFEFAGDEVELSQAKPGDLILFTGTDSTIKTIGHMGIIIKAEGPVVDFIHSSSGKAYGVTVSPVSGYYMGRFVKVIRIFG